MKSVSILLKMMSKALFLGLGFLFFDFGVRLYGFLDKKRLIKLRIKAMSC
jgi:hypothetical protein